MIDVLEVANAERQAIHAQFSGIHEAVKYITETVYHHLTVGNEGLTEGGSKRASWGVERWELREAGVGTSEMPNGETGKGQEGGCKGTKDLGEGPSGLSLADKGKGKQKEIMEEETLQEE